MRTRMSIHGRCAALLLLMTAIGCGGGKITNIGDGAKPNPRVLFFNASPDAGKLDFYLDDERYAASVPYVTEVSGLQQFKEVPFLDDENGTYDVGARPEGGGTDTELDLFAQAFARDANIVVAAFGLRNIDENEPTDNDKVFQVTLQSIPLTRPNGNKARLIAFNGFLMSKTNTNVAMNIQTPGNNPIFKITDIPFGTFKEALVDSGIFTYQLKRADVDESLIYAERSVELAPGGIYIVFLCGIEKENDADPPKPSDPNIVFVPIPSRSDQ